MPTPDSDKPLSTALHDWQVQPPREASFRAAVWARLQAARRNPVWTSYAKDNLIWMGGAVALALVLGAWTGREQGRAKAAAARTAIATTYVQALDARTMRMP